MNKKPSMQLLVYENRKQDPVYWLITDLRSEIAAFYSLFLVLETWECYDELKDAAKDVEGAMTVLDTLQRNSVPKEHPLWLEWSHRVQEQEKVVAEYAESAKQLGLYDLARAGDYRALRLLLDKRKSYEYEEWSVTWVSNPVEDLKKGWLDKVDAAVVKLEELKKKFAEKLVRGVK